MRRLIRTYYELPNFLQDLVAAQFFVQLVNTSFFMILNIYMSKQGYSDPDIANLRSFRFLSVLLLALPLGLLIKGRRLKPVFYLSSFLSPCFALLIVFGIDYQWDAILYMLFFAWGISFGCIQTVILPFILRNVSFERHSEAISLSFSTFGISSFLGGGLIYGLSWWDPLFYTEKNILIAVSILGFAGLPFLMRSSVEEHIPEFSGERFQLFSHDWRDIGKAVVPGLLISVGAGMTVPFLNLFFYHIYQVQANVYSILQSTSTLLAVMGMLLIPLLKRRVGYEWSIVGVQFASVLALVALAATEFFSSMEWALYAAVLFFIVRGPLMNMAGPLSTELTMYYVGEENQELMSALNTAIFSGAWFVSSRLFGLLRHFEFRYATIFFLTAIVYLGGISWYYFLIRDYKRSKESSR